MTTQSIKDNAQNIVGVLVGLTALRLAGLRFSKEHRASRWFSTVAANMAADGVIVWAPYN